MVGICAIVGGTKSLIGAAIATALVAVFFGISLAAVGVAARFGTQAIMGAAAGSYIFKILVMVILFGEFSGTSAFSALAFGLTALVLVFAYDGSLILWWTRTKMLYVEPDGER
ncbi:MAG TPA: hypothetical protein VGI58_01515 [Streptosporangiaceae bacterium]